MPMLIGTTAAAVLCGSLYLYVVCTVSEGGTLFLYVRVVVLFKPFIHLCANSYTPIGCTSQEKNLRGKQTWLASPMIDATEWCSCTTEMRDCFILAYAYLVVQVSGEHHNLTANSSDRSTIDRSARVHASASSYSYIFMHIRDQINERARKLGWHPRSRARL